MLISFYYKDSCGNQTFPAFDCSHHTFLMTFHHEASVMDCFKGRRENGREKPMPPYLLTFYSRYLSRQRQHLRPHLFPFSATSGEQVLIRCFISHFACRVPQRAGLRLIRIWLEKWRQTMFQGGLWKVQRRRSGFEQNQYSSSGISCFLKGKLFPR